MNTRTEYDLLGEMEVPSDAYYGIHALRAFRNFHLGRERMHPVFIRALAEVKQPPYGGFVRTTGEVGGEA